METRLSWIDPSERLKVTKQCELAGVCRATWYNHKTVKPVTEADLNLCSLIDQAYTKYPFYGSRRMVRHLLGQGVKVNRKRVQRLMRLMGLAGMAPGPNTSKKHPNHQVYPYLLRGVTVTKPNQVWGTDISVPQQAA